MWALKTEFVRLGWQVLYLLILLPQPPRIVRVSHHILHNALLYKNKKWGLGDQILLIAICMARRTNRNGQEEDIVNSDFEISGEALVWHQGPTLNNIKIWRHDTLYLHPCPRSKNSTGHPSPISPIGEARYSFAFGKTYGTPQSIWDVLSWMLKPRKCQGFEVC